MVDLNYNDHGISTLLINRSFRFVQRTLNEVDQVVGLITNHSLSNDGIYLD